MNNAREINGAILSNTQNVDVNFNIYTSTLIMTDIETSFDKCIINIING